MTHLEKILDNIKDLPTLPQVVSKIMGLVSDPRSSAEDVNKVIELDPVLTSKILKLVNSSYYGLSKKVTSVKQAIVILGFSTVKTLALSASVFDIFSAIGTTDFDREAFWQHSTATASGCKFLVQEYKIKDVDPEEAFVAGLLHDIGIIVLDQYAPEIFEEVLYHSIDNLLDYYEAEKEIMQTTHCEIGSYIARKWKLPESIENVINAHHSQQSTLTSLVKVVQVVDYLSIKKGIGTSGGYLEPQLRFEILEELGIEDSLEDIFVKAKEEMTKGATLLLSS